MPKKNPIAQSNFKTSMSRKAIPTHPNVLPETATMGTSRFVGNPTPTFNPIFYNQHTPPKMSLLNPKSPQPFSQQGTVKGMRCRTLSPQTQLGSTPYPMPPGDACVPPPYHPIGSFVEDTQSSWQH